tara:strand:+ start:1529 stop:1726 length:198 start_codon:yes stop_codon:yes gene_type:complete
MADITYKSKVYDTEKQTVANRVLLEEWDRGNEDITNMELNVARAKVRKSGWETELDAKSDLVVKS